jgi:hypothetical protein
MIGKSEDHETIEKLLSKLSDVYRVFKTGILNMVSF